jgi:ABC-2 type transport system ATP-binding protein
VGVEPVLRCSDLRKRFGDRAAVDGVGFEIAGGECYGLLGPNGAGKTTTISMICGLLGADGGTVVVAGRPVGPRAIEARPTSGTSRRRSPSIPTSAPARTWPSSAASTA